MPTLGELGMHAPQSQLRTPGISSLPPPVPFRMVCPQPPPTHPTTGTRPQRVSGWGAPNRRVPVAGSQEVLAILTKKSKLKRKRKYLVILIQADPILPALEFPGEKGKGR